MEQSLRKTEGTEEENSESLVSPELKVYSSPTYRYEKKSVVSGSSYAEVKLEVKKHPLLFSEIYQKRQVNSIYFDTPCFRFYEENVSGAPMRRKIRIRWYGESSGFISNPVLEVKGKIGLLGFKEQYSLSSFNLQDPKLHLLLKELVKKSSSSDEVKEYFKYLYPISLVSYSREYFSSKNQKFRLTVDNDVRYFEAKRGRAINVFSAKDRNIILEVKYDEEYENSKLSLFKNTPWRVMKNSKYVNSVDSIRKYS